MNCINSKILRLIVLPSAFILLFSCQETNKKKIEQSAGIDTNVVVTESDYDLLLPSPIQIFNKYKKTGLTYNLNTINPVKNSSKYFSNLSKSINTGVYLSDLSYLILNNKMAETESYVKTIKELSEQLGMENIVNQSTLSKFDRYINNNDSILAIMANVKMQLDTYFNKPENKNKEIVFFVGSFIEGLYISLSGYEPKNLELRNIIIEQLTISKSLASSLKNYPTKSKYINSLVNEFNQLDAMGKKLEAADGKLELDGLIAQVKTLRTTIVNGNY